MKALISFGFYLLFSLAAATAQAQEVPTSLQAALDAALGASSFQLVSNKSVEALTSDKDYKSKIYERVNSEENHRLQDLGVNSANIGLEVALPAALATMGVGGMALATGSQDLSVTQKSLWVGGGLFAAGSASAFSGVGIQAGVKAVSMADAKDLLNEGKVNRYSAEAAEKLAGLFGLSKGQEDALLHAINRKILRLAAKEKTKDNPSLDLLGVLLNTKYAGKPLLSENEASTLLSMRGAGADKKGEAKASLTADQKIAYLVAADAVFSAQLRYEAKGLSDLAKEKIQSRLDKNEALLGSIKAYRDSFSAVAPGAGEEGSSSSSSSGQ
jgi:hypothetical protein